MAGIRDDSAGGYGVWDDSELSWLDYLKAKGSDIGGGAYNALSNITGALSPIGTSPEGNMSLQVPPMVSGIADSYSRLAGTPSNPGNAYALSGVPELDAPIQQDMSNVLLSLYGGNALNPLARAPSGSVGMFAGRNAKTADHAALARAEELAGQGVPREQIWKDTGWFQGADDKWRFEIDDSGSRLSTKAIGELTQGYNGQGVGVWGATHRTAADVLQHPDMYDAYPALRNVDVSAAQNPSAPYSKGSYAEDWHGQRGGRPKLKVQANSIDNVRDVALHEFQHGIQHIEGFAPGSSPSAVPQKYVDAERSRLQNTIEPQGWDSVGTSAPDTSDAAIRHAIYRNIAGEVEARNVQARKDMTRAERVETPPWLTDTLRSDTGKPSIFGSAAATAGELPMDPASRMARAREMGFDTERTWYHGTNKDFDEFNADAFGSGGNVGNAEQAIFLTDNPAVADTYLGKNYINAASPHADGLVGSVDGDVKTVYNEGSRVLPLRARGGDDAFDIWDMGGGGYTPEFMRRALQEAMDGGRNGAVFENMRDPGISSLGRPKASNVMAIFDPKNIRSVNAAFDPARAGEAGLLLSDTGKPSIFGSAAATAGEQPRGITAYHGSPHDFDKFSLDKIGTGEGAQAYGHGLYFADNEGVARSYRDALSQTKSPMYSARSDVAAYGNIDGALANAERMVEKGVKQYEPVLDYLRAMKDGNEPPEPGKMYQVRINADPESFLDWDKPLSQQPGVASKLGLSARSADDINAEALRLMQEGGDGGRWMQNPEIVKRVDELQNELDKRAPDVTGADFYRGTSPDNYLHSMLSGGNSNPVSSAQLREAGIPGIRYLDGQSRADGAGSSNYVVFDDSLIEILKKYGMAGGALGAGALAQPDQASAQDLPDWLKF